MVVSDVGSGGISSILTPLFPRSQMPTPTCRDLCRVALTQKKKVLLKSNKFIYLCIEIALMFIIALPCLKNVPFIHWERFFCTLSFMLSSDSFPSRSQSPLWERYHIYPKSVSNDTFFLFFCYSSGSWNPDETYGLILFIIDLNI